MIKIVKAFAFIVPTIFMVALLLMIPSLSDVVSIFYVGLVGTFIGADLVSMVKRTKEMPVGEFDKLKTWRYVLASIALASLLAITFFQYNKGEDVQTALISFSSSILIISSMLIAGLDGNRIATKYEEAAK